MLIKWGFQMWQLWQLCLNESETFLRRWGSTITIGHNPDDDKLSVHEGDGSELEAAGTVGHENSSTFERQCTNMYLDINGSTGQGQMLWWEFPAQLYLSQMPLPDCDWCFTCLCTSCQAVLWSLFPHTNNLQNIILSWLMKRHLVFNKMCKR